MIPRELNPEWMWRHRAIYAAAKLAVALLLGCLIALLWWMSYVLWVT